MISMDKKYKTRNGRKVKIYSVEGNTNDHIHGAVMVFDHDTGYKWLFTTWTKDGRYSKDYVSDLDLVEVKERKKIERWINVYVFGGVRAELGGLHETKELAEEARGDKKTFACVKVTIECEEGEGL
jgi:hypothetical protein